MWCSISSQWKITVEGLSSILQFMLSAQAEKKFHCVAEKITNPMWTSFCFLLNGSTKENLQLMRGFYLSLSCCWKHIPVLLHLFLNDVLWIFSSGTYSIYEWGEALEYSPKINENKWTVLRLMRSLSLNGFESRSMSERERKCRRKTIRIRYRQRTIPASVLAEAKHPCGSIVESGRIPYDY